MGPFEIWKFDDAPEVYRNLSTNGGDEDWLIVFPEGETEDSQWTMEYAIERMAVCDVDYHTAPDGRRIAITCHA